MSDAVGPTRLRQGLYRFYGAALTSPRDELLADLATAAAYLETLGIEAFAFYKQWHTLTKSLGKVDSARDLAAEHVRLFASSMDRALCPPIESYYRARAEGGGMPEVVAGVQRRYNQLGITARAGSEPPDHAATELEAMSILCDREATAGDIEDWDALISVLEEEERFLSDHLAVWLPLFRRRIIDAASTAFYGPLVDATHAFVVHDLDLIGATRQRLRTLS